MNFSYMSIHGDNIENGVEIMVTEVSVSKSTLPLATFAVNFRFREVETGES